MANQSLADQANDERRNRIEGMQADLFGGGGSASNSGGRSRGGEYPNTYNPAEGAIQRRARSRAPAADDPRLQDLRQARIPRVWLDVAATIGYENFLAAWQVIANDRGVMDDRGRVYVPAISKFLSVQLARLTDTLIESGHSAAQIHRECLQCLGRSHTLSHINRLISRHRKQQQ